MALRSPIYLGTETLLAQAEYYGIEVPREAAVVEKTVRKRSGGGKAGLSGLGLDASMGTDVEYQSTYSLEPKEKATVSKVIDSLIIKDAVKVNPDGDTALSKDDLVEKCSSSSADLWIPRTAIWRRFSTWTSMIR